MKSPSQSDTLKPSTSVKKATSSLCLGLCSTMWLILTGTPSQRARSRFGPLATSLDTSN